MLRGTLYNLPPKLFNQECYQRHNPLVDQYTDRDGIVLILSRIVPFSLTSSPLTKPVIPAWRHVCVCVYVCVCV